MNEIILPKDDAIRVAHGEISAAKARLATAVAILRESKVTRFVEPASKLCVELDGLWIRMTPVPAAPKRSKKKGRA